MEDISAEVVERACSGDPEAFEELYRLASGFVYSVALRITNNRQEAQEVTQDVFVKVFSSLRKFQFRSSFSTWIYRIAANTAINAARKRAKELNRRGDFDTALRVTSNGPDARDKIEEKRKKSVVSALLDMLSPEHRAVITLREIEGLSYDEISRTLGINVNTVRSRLKRARESLMKCGMEVVEDEL